jgi:hypothetical protein
MKRNVIVTVIAAAAAVLAAPAFASSGYGPAPFYNPVAGAPSSQRGPGAPLSTLSVRQAHDSDAAQGLGGVASTRSASGNRSDSISDPALFRRP